MFIFLLSILLCGGCITQADVTVTETIHTDAVEVIYIDSTPIFLDEKQPEHTTNPFFIGDTLYFEIT